MKYRSEKKEDLPLIKEVLKQSNLRYDDFDNQVGNYCVSEKEGEIIGVGGFEICGEFGLMRSIAVMPKYRGKGVAKEIVIFLEGWAYDRGIRTLYLLTETAVKYFMKLNFSVRERAETPDAIVQTKQFSELCPSSALVMCRDIVSV